MIIDLESDFKKWKRTVKSAYKSQIPYATSRALNETASLVQQAEVNHIKKKFDRPTPFTLKGFYVKNSKKNRLVSEVGVKPIQSRYLDIQMKGGLRRAKKGKVLLRPVGIKLNKYGNVPRNRVKKELNKKEVFSGDVDGKPGIWRRYKSKKRTPKLLFEYNVVQGYKKRFRFRQIAERTVNKKFKTRLNKWMNKAIRTMK